MSAPGDAGTEAAGGESSVRVAVIGAGVSGLCAAKLLTEFGFDVTVYDRTPDVGGVWSRTRRYPGVTTQNNKGTYAFSDFPMPRAYPQFPSGAQVQNYLEDYATRFDLHRLIRLRTEVTDAAQDERTGTWTLIVRDLTSGTEAPAVFDHLIVATGIFCDPFVPEYPGREDFERAGGRVCAASDFTRLDDAADKDVVVVGYGKSACDIAEALSDVARSTTVVAREVTWKVPRRLAGLVTYKYILLTRFSEALFDHIDQRGFARFLTGPGRFLRNALLGGMGSIVRRQLLLDRLGLVPDGPFERVVRHAVSLATENFYEKIRDDVITLHRGAVITRLHEKDGKPTIALSDDTLRDADIVVCATGFVQRVPFLRPSVQDRLTDGDGNFLLYRQILPLDVPNLFFVGYSSSLVSPIAAEASAMWVVDYLAGGGTGLPSAEHRREFARRRLNWMIERTEGKQARGTNIIPFSIRHVDEILDEIGVNIGPVARLRQWLLPVKPAAYRSATAALHRRYPRGGADAAGAGIPASSAR
ncbi:flavin-containing monooxygenase [Nocardia nova]|uniref:flavin-containing monooxygenase n=1 Tax=Nocardia nova TaxID=37330 RepID=UPI001FE62E16|nr:NAD(P)/FAD-dependent oxidoreductase [Nocardia nova]